MLHLAAMAVTAAGLTTSAPLLHLSSSTPRHHTHTCSATPQISLWWRADLTGGFPLLHHRSKAATRPRQLKGNRFARAAQSSAKNEEDVVDNDLAITKARLHELSESFVLPANYLEKLPSDLRVDLKDAAFALSSGALNDECGEQAGDLLMQLSRTWERGDTQGAAAAAKQLLTLLDKVTTESSSAFVGRRCIRAGRYFTTTGKYEGGELQKIGKALVAVGEAFSSGNPSVTEAPVSTAREFKFGDLQVEITAQRAYIGAAVSFVFGLLSWQLTSGLQTQADNSLQYANDRAFLLATSLRGTLLAGGYFCAVLSICTTVGLLVLASTMNAEKK